MKESTIIKSSQHEVKLQACDDGIIRVKLPDSTYTIEDRNLVYISERAFLSLCAIEGTRINFLLPLKLNEERKVRDFLDYWGEKRLNELKNVKWTSFISYWKHVLDFVSKNVNVELCKPTYETYYVDNRDYGGSESVYFNIRLSYGVDWHHDFDKTSKLNDKLTSEQIDRFLESKEEECWFSKIHINFRPKADYIEDFVKF